MSIILGFLPFLVFAVMERLTGVSAGLAAATSVALVLCIKDWKGPRRHCGVLELVSLVVFGAMTAYAVTYSPTWSVILVRIIVDSALMLVMLASLLVGRPFTLSYASPSTRPAIWLSPKFIRGHYIVSGVWTIALLVIVVSDSAMLLWPASTVVAMGFIVSAILAAGRFTARYAASSRT